MSAAFRVSRAARNDIKNIGRYTQKTYGVDQRRKASAIMNLYYRWRWHFDYPCFA